MHDRHVAGNNYGLQQRCMFPKLLVQLFAVGERLVNESEYRCFYSTWCYTGRDRVEHLEPMYKHRTFTSVLMRTSTLRRYLYRSPRKLFTKITAKSTVRLKRTSPDWHSECIFQCPVAATTAKIGRVAAGSRCCRLETCRSLPQRSRTNSERRPIRHNIFRTHLRLKFIFNRL